MQLPHSFLLLLQHFTAEEAEGLASRNGSVQRGPGGGRGKYNRGAGGLVVVVGAAGKKGPSAVR